MGGGAGAERPFVSIVIPTWNRARTLDVCLRSAIAQRYPSARFEVIVADDGSSDATGEVVAAVTAVAPCRVEYLRLPHRGAAATRNAAARAARGSLVTFIDDDESMPEDYVERVTRALTADPALSGVGGPYRGVPGDAPRTCERCSLGDAEVVPAPDGTAEALLGGNMTVRREAFDAVGGFDEALVGRGEDTDWFLRARDLRFAFDPELWVAHRRAQRGVRALTATAFRQGLGVPLFGAKHGVDVRAHPGKVVRFTAHAVRRRCWNGVVRAGREAGICVGYVRFSLTSRGAERS